MIDPVTQNSLLISLDEMPGMVAPIADDKLLIAFQNSIDEFDVKTGERFKIANLETDQPSNRANDGACDALGRLWIGTMDTKAAKGRGALYCYNGQMNKVLDGLSVPNGICWAADGRTMYHIDSLAYCIKAYDFDMETGTLSNERVAVNAGNGPVMPDGMCIDEEGMLWVAMWGGCSVNRYNPQTGELIGQVSVDAPHVTSCAFGGPDMKQLLITTATDGLSITQMKQHPLSGSLFITETAVAGRPINAFAEHLQPKPNLA